MMNGLIYTALLIFFLIGLNAFFSLAETALTAASRAKMATLEKEGDVGGACKSITRGARRYDWRNLAWFKPCDNWGVGDCNNNFHKFIWASRRGNFHHRPYPPSLDFWGNFTKIYGNKWCR